MPPIDCQRLLDLPSTPQARPMDVQCVLGDANLVSVTPRPEIRVVYRVSLPPAFSLFLAQELRPADDTQPQPGPPSTYRASIPAVAYAPADPSGYKMPVFDDDDDDNVGHLRRRSDHPLPWPSLTPFARCALPEPPPTLFLQSTGCSSSLSFPWYRCRARVYAKVLLNVGHTTPPHADVVPALPRFDTDVRRPPTFPSALNALPATPVGTSHAATIFAFDVALLNDAAYASNVAQLDALNAFNSPLPPSRSRASNETPSMTLPMLSTLLDSTRSPLPLPPSPSVWQRSSSIGGRVTRGDTARQRRDSTPATSWTSAHPRQRRGRCRVDSGRYWVRFSYWTACLRRSAARVQMRPDRGPSVCCSRAGALSIDYVEVQVSEKGEGGRSVGGGSIPSALPPHFASAPATDPSPPRTYPPPPATPSRATSMAILRLATTYEIRHLRTRALHHLNVFFPTTPLFKGWRDLGNRAATFPDILAAMCPDILADARKCNAPFLAPACAYNLVCVRRDLSE
ncbi:hypothetical protein EV714DRAFT_275003 [Schizophyllum commune]